MAQNNLGKILSDQAGQTNGPEAVKLLAEVVKAYRAALEVYTESDFPGYHAIALASLKAADAELTRRRHKDQ